MNEPVYTQQFLRQRRFYLVLPALALPFLTFIYWKLLIRPLDQSSREESIPQGLQLSLPSADLKEDQGMDKLAYYRKADQDSASWAQQIKKDPYRQHQSPVAGDDSANQALLGLSAPGGKPKPAAAAALAGSGPESEVKKRLQALDRALSSSTGPSFEPAASKDQPDPAAPMQIQRLEEMMQQIAAEQLPEGQDPEMSQLDGMLDKLLQLQEKEKGTPESMPEGGALSAGLPVRPAASAVSPASLLEAQPDSSAKDQAPGDDSGFYGISDDAAADQALGLTAVIEKTQQLVSGNVIGLRLTSPASVAGATIQENTLIYGTASVSGERLKIKISTLKAAGKILPVNLSVYDLDGIEGIYIPGALSRQVAKQQLASQVQGYQLDTDAFSLGAQAASAGLHMGKMLLSRKTRLVQVTVTEGYKVILFDQSATRQ